MPARVSVVVPCWNERRFVERSLRTLLDGTFPADDMEVLVVDGGSTDGTRAILLRLAAADARLRILDNPRRITPVALNLGITAARGEIILRADAHTLYPRDYVAVLVRTLEESGADLVGCPADGVAGSDGAWAHAIALATGGAFATASPFRERKQSGPADTVPFGCWRKSLFARVGLFDERLQRNQDNEHASRILRDGGRIHLTAETRVGYQVRDTLRALCRHASGSGKWNVFTLALAPHAFRWRHILPGVFFCGVVTALVAVLVGVRWDEPALWIFGVAALLPYLTVDVAVATKKTAAAGRLWLALPVAFITACFHLSYGFGVARGALLFVSGAWRRQVYLSPTEATS